MKDLVNSGVGSVRNRTIMDGVGDNNNRFLAYLSKIIRVGED